MEQVVLFGTTNFSKMMKNYFMTYTKKKIVAFTVDRKYKNADFFDGLPVIPFDDIENAFPPSKVGIYIAVGYKNMNMVREKVYNDCISRGYRIENFIHPTAVISERVSIAEGYTNIPFRG